MTDMTFFLMMGGLLAVVAAAHAGAMWMGGRRLLQRLSAMETHLAQQTSVPKVTVLPDADTQPLPASPPRPPGPVRVRRPTTLVFLNRDETAEVAERAEIDGLRRSPTMTVDNQTFHAVRHEGDTVYYRQL